MTPKTIDAVYQDGVFRPTAPVELPEGTAVRVTVVVPEPPPRVRDPEEIMAHIRAAHAKFNPATDNPEVTSRNVDEILYGGPNGAR